MASKKEPTIVKAKPRSGFTQIFNSFLDSDMLTQYEKLVFIAIKSFADNKTKQAYPSLATISRITGTSLSQVRRSIKHMEELGVLDIQRRKSERYGNVQNLYRIHDDPKFWSRDNSEDDDNAVAQELSNETLISVLETRGFKVTKDIKKEPSTGTDQSSVGDTFRNQYSLENDNMKLHDSQEKYSFDRLKEYYSYDIMVNDYPLDRQQIDYVMQILYDTLNSNAKTVRVQKTDRPKDIVVSVLLKLTYEEIMYVVEKYKAQTDRIEYPKAYILTQLYEAKGQMNADLTNRVQHDMSGDGMNGIV